MTEIEELVLNNPEEDYRLFYGQNIKQMPKIFKDSDLREPATVSQIVEMKNRAFYSANKKFKDSWWSSYFDSADAVVYEPDGIMVVNKPLILRQFSSIDSKKDLIDGALKLTEEQYNSLKGYKISREELQKHINFHSESDLLSRTQVLDNPIWNYLFDDNPELLREHVSLVFKGENQKNAMRIFVKPYSEEFPVLRLWNIRGNTSDLYGAYNLDEDRGKLVGVIWGLNQRKFHQSMTKSFYEIQKTVKEISDETRKILKISDIEPTSHC